MIRRECQPLQRFRRLKHRVPSRHGCSAAVVLTLLAVSAGALRAQSGFCLLDAAPADGHPLFGNPEAMLNPIMAVQGAVDMTPTNGAIGDLDGDGDLDAVSTWAGRNPAFDPTTNICVLLNRGDGTFFDYAIYPCGDYPTSVAIGDLNGDGLNDLAVTNDFSGQVSVLINAGGGTFPNRVAYAVGCQPRMCLIADFNGDGKPDVAVGNAESNSVSILLNTGAGVLAPAVTYPVLNVPDGTVSYSEPLAFGGPYMAAGDLDGDGDLDIAVPGGSDGVAILRNNGNGSFVAPTGFAVPGAYAWSVAIGDLDGDGDLDLATVRQEIVSIAFNQGNGTFAPPVHYSINFTQPGSLHDGYKLDLGDLDHDGDLDMAIGQTAWGQVVVMMNNGDGTFGPLITYPADEVDPVVVDFGDMNGDGHLDLAVFVLNSFRTRKLCILLNNGSGKLMTDQESHNWWAPPSANWVNTSDIAFADFDADGRPDIAVLNQGSPSIGVLANLVVRRNLGHALFTEPIYYAITGHYPSRMALGDMDGDGDVDVVTCGPENYSQYTPGHVAVLLNAGDGTFLAPVTYPTGGVQSFWLVLADVDADGDLDVITSNYFSSDISVLLNNGSGGLSVPLLRDYPFLSPGVMVAGDINGDGKLDLVINKLAGIEAVTTMFGHGDGTFTAGAAYYPSLTPSRLLLMDLDHDGHPDLVVSSLNLPWEPVTFTTLKNHGDGTFGDAAVYWAPGMSGARALAASDIDGDGWVDVAVGNDTTACVFFGNASGTFAPGACYGSGYGILGLALGDLDGDGEVDLGTANGAGGSWNYSILWNRHCAPPVPDAPADFDTDGDVDLADYALLAGCMQGPLGGAPSGGCWLAAAPDLDGDGDADLRDADRFMNLFQVP